MPVVQVQIQLERLQYERLARLAAGRDTSIADVVREAVDDVLAREDADVRWKRLLGASGRARSADGASDVSTRHDDYLSEIWMDDLRRR